MDNKPMTEQEAALLLEFLKTYQTLPWHKRQVVNFWLWWGATKTRLPGVVRAVIGKLSGPQAAALAVCAALVLYLVIGGNVQLSGELVRFACSVGVLVGAVLVNYS